MALAEARAAWQRTANRCLVQEDAKRAPKLACCPTVSPAAKLADTGPTCGQDIINTASLHLNLNPSCSNLSPSSKWWLQMQPNYGCKKGLIDEQFNSLEGDMESYRMHEIVKDPSKLEIKEDVLKDGFEVSKNANELYYDSESSWIGGERSSPWWRTADTDELALFVAHRSLNHVENCDLPNTQNTRVKSRFSTHLHESVSLAAEMSGDTSLRDTSVQKFDNDTSKAELMEALCHSQTRAREAERAAGQACAEKDDIVKLVFRQASQLFAYKQLLQLVQLENMYLQYLNNNESQSVPAVLPRTPQRTRKIQNRKRARGSCPWYDDSKYAVFFALGFGLVGAGFLLGWTVGWMLPTW